MASTAMETSENGESEDKSTLTNNKNSLPLQAEAGALADSMHRLSIQPVSNAPVHSTSPKQLKHISNASAAHSISPKQSKHDLHNGSRSASTSRPGSSASRPGSYEPGRRASSSSYTQASSPKLLRKSSSSSLKNIPTTPTKPTLHRSTSAYGSPKASASPTMTTVYEPPPLTANSVASDFFKAEWSAHKTSRVTNPDAVAIVHDSCYGHRFARPKTTKGNLSLIVERPERIQASVLGLSTAYVRCGERHKDGRSPPVPNKEVNREIPFAIHKSTRLTPLDFSAVTNVHGTKWMQELTGMCHDAEAKLAAGGRELTRPEDPTSTIPKPLLHENDLYLCKDSLEALQGALGGVFDGIDAVFSPLGLSMGSSVDELGKKFKRSFVCIRPPGHHCSADFPSGFCWLNNVHVGIDYAAQSYGLTHAAIIDFDLHHGDGSQAITWERNAKAMRAPKNASISKKTAIGYFSIHDINSYPCEDGDFEKVRNASVCVDNAHGQSIWNVHLQPWKTEPEFWDLYQTRYSILLEKTRLFLRTHTQKLLAGLGNVQPRAAIFISAGFDASEWEGQGMQRHKVNVPTEFYARFTSDIIKLAEEEGTGVEGRVISVLEGGYSDRALTSGVLSHMVGLTAPSSTFSFPTDWWSASKLTELEHLVNPPPVAPKKPPRHLEPPTYTTPTQSYAAKVVDPAKMHRSTSNSNFFGAAFRPPTPPPPEVNWAIAALEFGKILIPNDRQIGSHKHEELAEHKAKRERHSLAGITSTVEPTGDRMQLRDRKAKVATRKTANGEALPAHQQTNRRRTISDLPETTGEAQTFNRPESSSSSRPPSSRGAPIPTPNGGHASSTGAQAQVQGQTDTTGLQVAKTRRSSGVRSMKAADNTMPPPPISAATKGQRPPGAVRAKSESNFKPTPTMNPDVDQLTAGVKKITLKLSPQDALAAKELTKPASAESKLAKKPVSSRTSKPPTGKPPLAKSSSTKAAKNSKLPAVATAASTSETTQSAIPNPASSTHATHQVASEQRLPSVDGTSNYTTSTNSIGFANASAPVALDHRLGIQDINESELVQPPFNGIDSSMAPQSTSLMDSERDTRKDVDKSNPLAEFVHYNPPAQQSGSLTYVKPSDLTWLPPNSGTPSHTPAKRGDLPTFSSVGAIPFAMDSSVPSSDPLESSTEDTQSVDSRAYHQLDMGEGSN